MDDKWHEKQIALCRRHGVEPVPVSPDAMVGIAHNVRSGLLPINGVRTRPERGTCGWYIWAGAHMSEDPDFFAPLHVSHLPEWCEPALPFLQLPPGWRFLVAGDYIDVWFDPEVDLSPMQAPS
jgi:hypothetical protein